MLFYHFVYDLRYVFGYNVAAYQENPWFYLGLRGLIVLGFLTTAGISCSFSRNNRRRAGRLLARAALTLVTELSFISGQGRNLRSGSTFCIYLPSAPFLLSSERKENNPLSVEHSNRRLTGVLIFLAPLFIFLGYVLPQLLQPRSNILLPFGVLGPKPPGMLDYLPLLPWAGFFVAGIALGRVLYTEKKTLFPKLLPILQLLFAPLVWCGRHAMLIYITHQPIFLLAIYLFRFTGAGR